MVSCEHQILQFYTESIYSHSCYSLVWLSVVRQLPLRDRKTLAFQLYSIFSLNLTGTWRGGVQNVEDCARTFCDSGLEK